MYNSLSPEILCYSFNTSNNRYYNFEKPYWLNKMPLVLKVETTEKENSPEKIKKVIHSFSENWEPEFFTELHPTGSEYLFFGNDEIAKPKNTSFILFYFQPDPKILTCLFYNNYTPAEGAKVKIIESVIDIIKAQKN